MEKTVVFIKWLGEQACKCISECFSIFKEFQEENIPLFTRSRTMPKYHGSLTPPNEEDRIDILVEEQPTIISIIDNRCQDSPIMKPNKEDDTDTEVYYDANAPITSV